jgi:deoxyadenosine/deoxycytidine kinase
MIVTLDGADLVGKTSIAKMMQEYYGFVRAPTVVSAGKIPLEISKRVYWYEHAPSDLIIRTILESDINRRSNLPENSVIERGAITVIANCIAKTMIRDNIEYSASRDLVETIANGINYFPQEDLRVYLRVSKEDLKKLEQREINRNQRGFNNHEKLYYPLLIDTLEIQAKKLDRILVNPFDELSEINKLIGKELEKWKKL